MNKPFVSAQSESIPLPTRASALRDAVITVTDYVDVKKKVQDVFSGFFISDYGCDLDTNQTAEYLRLHEEINLVIDEAFLAVHNPSTPA